MVYLWCDGNEKGFNERKRKFLSIHNIDTNEEASGELRFFDNEELRYSLRSLEEYAPWINHVYIITDRQVPKWLNLKYEKVTVVDHSEIMPSEVIPCFNSAVIEYFLPFIPGLQEKFLYGNDDMFFGDSVYPSDFFNGNKPIVRVRKCKGRNLEVYKAKKDYSYYGTLVNSVELLKRFYKVDEEWYEMHHNNVVYIPNAISQNDCAILEEKRNVVITVARIEPKQKRQHLLIEAFNLLKWNYPDWKVEIWGENYVNKEYYNYCLELVNKYNLREKISFCDTTDNVDEKLRNASIFAFPSCSEGFALALGEAMAAGLPSVGFKNCPAVNELIKNGSNGILCEETVEDFARGLVELMDDADKRKRYGSQAKEDMKQYMPEKVWDKWEELINKTVSDYKKK